MKIYINEDHEIKAVHVNDTGDNTLKEIEVEDNFLEGWCDECKKCFCYEVNAEEGHTSVYPYVYFPVVEAIQEGYDRIDSLQKTIRSMEPMVRTLNEIADDQALKVPELYPEWSPVGVSYQVGERVRFAGALYRVLTAHTSQESWTPTDAPSLFTKVLIEDPDIIPDWEQPDSTNPYQKGDKVKHNGKTWESLVDGNVWEPGVTGTENLWKEVTE